MRAGQALVSRQLASQARRVAVILTGICATLLQL